MAVTSTPALHKNLSLILLPYIIFSYFFFSTNEWLQAVPPSWVTGVLPCQMVLLWHCCHPKAGFAILHMLLRISANQKSLVWGYFFFSAGGLGATALGDWLSRGSRRNNLVYIGAICVFCALLPCLCRWRHWGERGAHHQNLLFLESRAIRTKTRLPGFFFFFFHLGCHLLCFLSLLLMEINRKLF